jgi:Protein of unknown function (DUF3305)
MSADAVMPVTVVVERRASNHAWQDHVWRPLGVLPRMAGEPGQVLASDQGWTQYYGGDLDIELYRGETDGYRTNLSQASPVVYVVLRRNAEADMLEFEPFLVTVCPYEAMSYGDGNDDIVEGVPMPPEVGEWLREFVALHHVDRPFVKRKNKRHRDDEVGKRPQPGRVLS